MLEMTRNTTITNRRMGLRRDKYYKHIGDKPHSAAGLPYVMFLAGAFAVCMYNRKNDIVRFTKKKFFKVYTSTAFERLQISCKLTTNWVCECSIKYGQILLVNLNNAIIKLWNKLYAFIKRKEIQKPRINMLLLKKLQEVGNERKNLGQLLIAAIHENKNIRMQYELENMAKNRLARHIENTQKVIKENRSCYVNFQQLYMVTHQENSFLKSRVRKLTLEKEQAEKNLLEIMNEVYKSKNKQLKDFCSRFTVKTARNLLNADLGAEIQKFLDKSRTRDATTTNSNISERPGLIVNETDSLPDRANLRFAEIIQDDILVPLVSDAPRCKGLPGEFVCTVKDKDGLIAKLYEYDFTSDLDDGDTIRRIREYSVYFDKDCLLDSIRYVFP